MKKDIQQEKTILKVLSTYKKYVLYGMSGNEVRPSYFVGTYLQSQNVDFISINPKFSNLFGRPCYPSLSCVPSPFPEVAVIFRRAEYTLELAQEAMKMGAKVVWLQLGIKYEPTKRIVLDMGLDYVEDRCIKVEMARYGGKLYQAGFNTGIISSKKRVVK